MENKVVNSDYVILISKILWDPTNYMACCCLDDNVFLSHLLLCSWDVLSTLAGNVSERHVSPEAEETGLVHVSETTSGYII